MNKLDNNNQDLSKVPINYSNTFRIGFSENEFNIDFGIKGNDDEVMVVSSAVIPVKLMENLIFALLISIREYEEEYETKVLMLGNEEDESEE